MPLDLRKIKPSGVVPPPVSVVPKLPPPTPPEVFVDALGEFKTACRQTIQFADNRDEMLIDFIACICACPHISRAQELLWGYAVGPPSAGKSMVTSAFSDWEGRTTTLTELTRNALLSAYDPNGRRSKARIKAVAFGQDPEAAEADLDPSLLPKLDGQMLIIPDATGMLADPSFRDKVIGTFRTSYSSEARKASGTLGSQHAAKDVRYGLLMGLTDAGLLDAQTGMQQMGERMVVIRIEQHTPTTREEQQTGRQALRSRKAEDHAKALELRQACQKWMTIGINQVSAGPIPEADNHPDQVNYLIALASVLVKLRTQPGKGGRVPTERNRRMVKVLAGFADIRARLSGRDHWDQEDLRFVRRIAVDTVPERINWIISYLYSRMIPSSAGMRVKEIHRATGVPGPIIQAQLAQWLTVGIARETIGHRYAVNEDFARKLVELGYLPIGYLPRGVK